MDAAQLKTKAENALTKAESMVPTNVVGQPDKGVVWAQVASGWAYLLELQLKSDGVIT